MIGFIIYEDILADKVSDEDFANFWSFSSREPSFGALSGPFRHFKPNLHSYRTQQSLQRIPMINDSLKPSTPVYNDGLSDISMPIKATKYLNGSTHF